MIDLRIQNIFLCCYEKRNAVHCIESDETNAFVIAQGLPCFLNSARRRRSALTELATPKPISVQFPACLC